MTAVPPPGKARYRPDKGAVRVYVEALQAVPLPIMQWVIPK